MSLANQFLTDVEMAASGLDWQLGGKYASECLYDSLEAHFRWRGNDYLLSMPLDDADGWLHELWIYRAPFSQNGDSQKEVWRCSGKRFKRIKKAARLKEARKVAHQRFMRYQNERAFGDSLAPTEAGR